MADDRYTLSYTGEQVDELLGKIDNLGAATQSTDGLMSSEDKAKVDGIEDGAQENVIESVTLNGVAQQVLNKAVDIVLGGATYMGIVYQDGGSSTPPTQKVFYLTGENGTYTNFNNIVVNDGEVAFLRWTGTAWVKDPIVTKDLIQDVSHTFYEDQTLDAGVSLKVGSWSNIKLSSTGGQTIAEYIASQIEVIKQFTYTVADSLPTASADTMYIIYLVPSANPQAQNARDEFITVRSGSEGSYTYAWEQIGSTEMDLSDYAKKDGVYLELFAGMAQGIVDTRSAGTPQEFTRRKSGGDGVGYMTRIKGNSIVWNQLLSPKQFVSLDGDTGWGNITCTENNDGSYTVVVSETLTVRAWIVVYLQLNGHTCYWNTGASANAKSESNITATFNNQVGHSGITTGTASSTSFYIFFKVGTAAGTYTFKPGVTDLSLLFNGSVPGGYTAADFERDFPLGYYAPNPGAIKNNCATGLLTDGFNQWDEEWEVGDMSPTTGNPFAGNYVRSKNFCKCFGGVNYYNSSPNNLTLYFYDAGGNFISANQAVYGNAQFTTPANAALFKIRAAGAYGTTYKNDICINLSGARNGQYEPHWSDTTDLPITTATGKLNGEGESVVISPDGLAGVGTAYDEGIVEKGMWTKTKKRLVNVVISADDDLSKFVLSSASSGVVYYSTGLGNAVKVQGNALTVGYGTDTTHIYASQQTDMTVRLTTDGAISIKNTAQITESITAEQARTLLAGMEIWVELATPKEYILDTPVPVTYQVDKDGTETVTTPEGTAPTSAPFKADTNYSISVGNLVRALEALQNA